MSEPRRVLDIKDLTITRGGDAKPELDRFSLALNAGETAVLLGESGSGKEALFRALAGALEHGERNTGTIQFGQAAFDLKATRQHVSGLRVAYVPNAASGVLSPNASVLSQLSRILARKLEAPRSSAKEEIRLTLERLEGAPTLAALRARPGVLDPDILAFGFLATAMAQTPDLVLADHLLAELSPTQARAVANALLAEQKRLGFALVYAARGTLVTTWLRGRVFVMRNGRIVEEGPVSRLSSPQAHAYTQTLYRALGKPSADAALKQASRGEPILQVRGLKLAEQNRDDRRNREGLTFDLRRGSGVALIGEAGSGRRELVRALLGLEKPAEGRTIFDSVDIGVLSNAMMLRLRRRVAFITGDDDALDPRMSVHDTVEEPLRAHLGLARQHMASYREAALKRVGLNTLDGSRAVATLSPFDRRRLQIARAIVSVPRLAVIEEPQRGLGPLEQAVMLDLLKEFRAQEGPAFLVLTANFSLAQALANDAVVFKDGRVVERGPMADILCTPKDAYTKSLIAAVTPAPLDTLSQSQPQS